MGSRNATKQRLRRYPDKYWLQKVREDAGGEDVPGRLGWPMSDPDRWELDDLVNRGLLKSRRVPGRRGWIEYYLPELQPEASSG